MNNKTVSIYEQELLNLCKKARVKHPISLIDKKIKFSLVGNNRTVTIFSKINQLNTYSGEGVGIIIYLSATNRNGDVVSLIYDSNKQWLYTCDHNGQEILKCSIDSISFGFK